MTTASGGWKAPIRFLPRAWLTPTLPPIALSTWADDGGRHLHDAQAAQERGRGEAGEVAEDAAADDDHHRLAIDAGVEQGVVDLGDRAQVLGALAVGHEDDRRSLQAGGNPGALPGPDARAGDDDGAIRAG